MVDVAVEILSCSVTVPKENLTFTVKTWWTQVEVEGNKNYVRLPVLPIIEPFYRMKSKDTIVFVEVWYFNDELFPPGARRFLGMAKSNVDFLLSHPQASPSMEWLDVYDPIENLVRGKMLLKVHANFTSDKDSSSPPAVLQQIPPQPPTTNSSLSSYFSTKQPLTSVESSPYTKSRTPLVPTKHRTHPPTSDVTSSKPTTNKPQQHLIKTVPPRSTRIAAAIYGDYPDGLGK